MLRTIRRYIWRLKDKGVHVRTVFLTAALVILLTATIIAAFIHHGKREKASLKKNEENSIVITTYIEKTSDSGKEEGSETANETVSVVSESESAATAGEESMQPEYTYENFENLKSFLPEDKYNEITEKINTACAENNVAKATLLSYQVSNEKNMSIDFFIKLDNGVIYQCTYSFSKSTLIIMKSSLTEDSIIKMQKAEEESESKALAKAQKQAEKKLQKERKKAAKKKKKKATNGG